MTLERAAEILDPEHREHYESIEVVNEACNIGREAIGKQIKKKPKLSTAKSTVCPNCGRFIDRHEQKHGNIDIPCCKWCGQAIDWSDNK